VFRVLLELVAVVPDAVGGHVAELTPGIQAALQVGARSPPSVAEPEAICGLIKATPQTVWLFGEC
jgi:hypothetical protein